MFGIKDTGLTTIEQVRLDFEYKYNSHKEYGNWWLMLVLKCWQYHSESRHRNGNPPFSFRNYENHMYEQLVLEQVKYDMIDCTDLGGKEAVINRLNKRMGK